MQLLSYEIQVREYITQRCREHVELQQKLLGRTINFDYRFEHTRTAVEIADNLACQLGVDPPLARITTWLHDIAKCWDSRFGEEINWVRANNHGITGGEEAAQYLRTIGFPEDLVSQVQQAIGVHVGYIKDYILDRPLDALLWDADKLSKISPAGIMHHLGGIMVMGNQHVDMKEFFTDLELDWRRGIRNSLNTEIARQWADQELESVAGFQTLVLTALGGSLVQEL